MNAARALLRLRDANVGKAYFLNFSLHVLRVLVEHCVDLVWRGSNPARGAPEFMRVKAELES